MKKVLLPLFYLPPISWFSEFLNPENEIILEKFENFPKQTYRNRANIYGANGRLSLVIPIAHSGARAVKDIKISYAEDWQKLHWKSLKTAYQSSPYFEFYEDHLCQIYDKKENFLLDFNLRALEIISDILKQKRPFTFTAEYFKNPEQRNLRDAFSAKKDFGTEMAPYHQVFSEKFGFIADLSVVDLLCNSGPEALLYIKNLKKI